jgi:methionyl-tRNA synthetase
MSKILGNFISQAKIRAICEEFGRDVFRYFLLREVPFGADGDFSRDSLRHRYNGDLANGVGNLLSRTTNMISRYFDGRLPPAGEATDAEQPVQIAARALRAQATEWMDACAFGTYIGATLRLAAVTNQYIDQTAPFKLAKDPDQRQRLGTILNTCAQAVRIVLEHLRPIMPESMQTALAALGADGAAGTLAERTEWGALAAGAPIEKAQPLWPRKTDSDA